MNRRRVWSCGILLVVAVASWLIHRGGLLQPGAIPAPPLPASQFVNTAPEAEYVGNQTCVTCHADEHRTYLQTAHSQALGNIDPALEPPDGAFIDPSSGRSYRIYRKDGKLRHQESVREAGQELVLADYAMQHVIGSGRFSRSYLFADQGFFMESPVTWYASRPGWAISPGYDQYNEGFERPALIRCVNCHAGRVSSIDGSSHRLAIHEQTISCERCHGPGSLHAARWKKGDSGSGDPDFTIVHPGRLNRELKEAICSQCHLQGVASVEVRGRGVTSFRPGLPLQDIRVEYGFASVRRSMRVAGHTEQMRLSRCYQASDTLTCTTCHAPHAKPSPGEAQTHYRKACLSCHSEQSCKLPLLDRSAKAAGDNCMACHMPQVPTEIPHFAFTHHRIAIHRAGEQAAESDQPGTLAPLDDVSHLPQLEQDRCLGLAYTQLLSHAAHNRFGSIYRVRARKLLEDVWRRGAQDGEVAVALAALDWQRDAEKSVQHATAALKDDQLSAEGRVMALYVLSSLHMQHKRFVDASTTLEHLVRIRRVGDDWHMLSVCREQAGDLPSSLEAARRAADISSQRPEFQERIAGLLTRLGDPTGAAAATARARKLAAIGPGAGE